jgi:hypothetical protein
MRFCPKPRKSSGAPILIPLEDFVKKRFTAPAIRLESTLSKLTLGLVAISGPGSG